MKTLAYTIASEIDEYDLIADSKEEPSYSNLGVLRADVILKYAEYRGGFNNIHNIPANTFNAIESSELRNCYNNSTVALGSLKNRLIKSQTTEFQFLCPYCLIIKHTTFDHYLPQEEHPVFSVCANNLVPCCGPCNQKKLSYWKQNGQRAILHFYNDLIPNTQFLFCDLNFNGIIPILTFRLNFPNGYNGTLRNRIEKHFERLDLIARYNEYSPGLLSNVIIDFGGLDDDTTSAEAKRFLLRKANKFALKYGDNYWYSVGYKALNQSNQYIANLLNGLYD